MIPVRHPLATRHLGRPADWDEAVHGPCSGLAVVDTITEAGPAMVSLWEPTPDELFRLVQGAKVMLTLAGTGHPPVAIGVGAIVS